METKTLFNYSFNKSMNVRYFLLVSVAVFFCMSANADGQGLDQQEYVDLGLPSGLLWATHNIGATKPEEIGGYFAWGETNPKQHFSWDNYQYYSNGSCQSLGSDISGTQYDAATINWGSEWRMPKKIELQELANNCVRTLETINEVSGIRFTGPNGNSIFIPKGGRDYEEGKGPSESNACGLWSSTSYSNRFAYRAWEWSSISYSYRCQGFPIRPVRDKKDDVKKCETPTITYFNCKLIFRCETEGAVCHSTITDTDIASYSGNEVQLGVTYNISVYATKGGYEDSEVATATLCWLDVEPRTEGLTDGDAVAELKALPVLIQTGGSTITVQGADDGTPITVCGIDGKIYGTAASVGGVATMSTSLQPGSVAVVKIGERSVKVLIK